MASINEDSTCHPTMMSVTVERLSSVKGSAYNQVMKWMERLKIQECVECIKIWMMEHPLLALFTTILILTTSIPIMIFLSFAVFVVIFGIISFAFIEGLLLTTSTVILLTIVGFAASAALGLTGFILSCYFIKQLGHRFLGVTTQKVRDGYNGVVTWYKPKEVSQESLGSMYEGEEVKKE